MIRVEIFLQERRQICSLWDISTGGCCIRSRSPLLPDSDSRLRLVIHSPDGRQAIETDALLLWSKPLGNLHYAGLRFAPAVDFSGSFLKQLLQQ